MIEGSEVVEEEARSDGFAPAPEEPDIPQMDLAPDGSSGPGRSIKMVLALFSLGMVVAGFVLMRTPRDSEGVRPRGPQPSQGIGSSSDPGSAGGSAGGAIDPRTGQPLPKGGSTPGGTPDPAANRPFGALKFEVKVIPTCGEIGKAMRAEILTTPGAAITLAVVYKDGQTYGQWGTFRADLEGRLIYPWTVPPVAPEGLARFLAGGDDESRQESAAGYWNFTVARVGAC